MNIKKITNIIVAIFAMTVFFIATAPKLFADSSILTTKWFLCPCRYHISTKHTLCNR